MIMIDTSAWIEFLRDTGSPVCRLVDEAMSQDTAVCDAIRMEVLAGARDERHLGQLRGLLARSTLIPTGAPDYEEAAGLYRTCRRSGETARKLVDCLIASVAIGADLPLLHADVDFEVLGRHTALLLVAV
jgi:predicted nucleic acid-binding protein